MFSSLFQCKMPTIYNPLVFKELQGQRGKAGKSFSLFWVVSFYFFLFSPAHDLNYRPDR
jgi:hypothetical protein